MSIPKSDTLIPNESNNPVKLSTLDSRLTKSKSVNSLPKSKSEKFKFDKPVLER